MEPDATGDFVHYSDYADLERQIAELRTELDRAIDERDEARQEPWPKWADEIRKCLEGYGVDPGDEWDLPEQFEIWIAGVVENETARAEAAEAEIARLKALPLKDEVEREAVWLIERIGWGDNEPHWYAENGTGWHRWTKVAADAKRFASKSEAEAYPAYQQIADDPSITLTEHVFLSRLRAGEQEGWRGKCATEGCDKKASFWFERGDIGSRYCYDCYMRVQSLSAAPSEHGGERE